MVSVKLVSEVGVGTVAAGVAKGNADEVLISGHDGGTGASPLSRSSTPARPGNSAWPRPSRRWCSTACATASVVQVDGQMKTGRDVVIGALLGAERFGFGTSALVSLGCLLMRKCHLGTCPVGIATQDPELRKRFAGKPEYVVRFLTFVAEEVRQIMAQLGFRTFDDMIGRVDRLSCRKADRPLEGQGAGFLGRVRPARPVERLRAALRAAADRRRTRTTSTGRSWRRCEPRIESERADAAGHADPQRPPHGGHDPQQPHRQALGRGGPARRHHRHHLHAARPGRASGRSWPPASRCS